MRSGPSRSHRESNRGRWARLAFNCVVWRISAKGSSSSHSRLLSQMQTGMSSLTSPDCMVTHSPLLLAKLSDPFERSLARILLVGRCAKGQGQVGGQRCGSLSDIDIFGYAGDFHHAGSEIGI